MSCERVAGKGVACSHHLHPHYHQALAAARGVTVSRVLVTHRAGKGAHEGSPGWVLGRDVSLDTAVEEVKRNSLGTGSPSVTLHATAVSAEDPLFLLYTSGSTGAPKGVLHTAGGYMVYTGTTFKYIFDSRPSAPPHPSAAQWPFGAARAPAATPADTFFCTADLGWVTGHTYIAYGPLLNGAHTLLFEGVPTHPGPDRLWQVRSNTTRTELCYAAPSSHPPPHPPCFRS